MEIKTMTEPFKFTREEIEKMEYIVNRWIRVKEEHRTEWIVYIDSLKVRDIEVEDQMIEVALIVGSETLKGGGNDEPST